MTRRSWLFLMFLYCGIIFASNDALSSPNKPSSATMISRRRLIRLVAITLGSTISAPIIQPVDATCLPGDTAPDCIGVYKERIPESSESTIRMSYGAFRPNRQDVVLTNPTSFDEAIGMLKDQCLALNDIERLVGTGDLEEAGILVLRVLPKITVAGRFVARSVQTSAPQIQNAFQQTEQLISSVDVMVGRGLKGKLGTSAVAQLQILSELSATKNALDFLIQTAQSGAERVFGVSM